MIKKIYILFCLILSGAELGFTQTFGPKEIGHTGEVGLLLSPEQVNMYKTGAENNGYENREWKSGFCVGISVKVNLITGLNFETGLMMSYKGFKMNDRAKGIENYEERQYVEVPIGLGYVIKPGRFRCSLGAAIIPGYLNDYSGVTYKNGFWYNTAYYTDDFRLKDKIVVGGKLKFSLGYQINNPIFMSLAPHVYTSFWMPSNSVLNDNNQYHYIAYGIDISFVYCFGYTPTF